MEIYDIYICLNKNTYLGANDKGNVLLSLLMSYSSFRLDPDFGIIEGNILAF